MSKASMLPSLLMLALSISQSGRTGEEKGQVDASRRKADETAGTHTVLWGRELRAKKPVRYLYDNERVQSISDRKTGRIAGALKRL